MTPDDVVDVLTAAATFDQRNVGRSDVVAWHAAIGDLTRDDAIAAVIKHYQESTDRMMPAHIRRNVDAVRDARLRKHGEIVPDVDPDDPAWNDRYHQMMCAVRDGRPVPPLGELAGGRRQIEAGA